MIPIRKASPHNALPDDPALRLASLPTRCREVLAGIMAGRSNKEIAHQLGISIRTVEFHRARMMKHLGARHVADAVRIALHAEARSNRSAAAETDEP